MQCLAWIDLSSLDDWGLQRFFAKGQRDQIGIVEHYQDRNFILIRIHIVVDCWDSIVGDGTSMVMTYLWLEEKSFFYPAFSDGAGSPSHARFEAQFGGLDWHRVAALQVHRCCSARGIGAYRRAKSLIG